MAGHPRHRSFSHADKVIEQECGSVGCIQKTALYDLLRQTGSREAPFAMLLHDVAEGFHAIRRAGLMASFAE
jgi:hypothetical protein